MEGRLKEYPECCLTIVAKDNCWLNQVKLAYLVGAKLCSCCSKKKLRDKKKALLKVSQADRERDKGLLKVSYYSGTRVILPSRSYMKY